MPLWRETWHAAARARLPSPAGSEASHAGWKPQEAHEGPADTWMGRALTGTCLSAELRAQPVPRTRLGCSGISPCWHRPRVPARPLGIPPLHPCQGLGGRRGSSAWPRHGGCTGPAPLWPSCHRIWAPSPFLPVLPSTSGWPQRQQRPGAPVSIICSSLPGFLCQQGGSAQCPCPGSSSRSWHPCQLPPREGSCFPTGPGEPGSSGGCRPRLPRALHHNWICICPAFYCMEIEL